MPRSKQKETPVAEKSEESFESGYDPYLDIRSPLDINQAKVTEYIFLNILLHGVPYLLL